MKVVHTADWHWSETKRDKCLASSEFIIQQLESIRPDVHVIAGDYWDKRQVLASSSAVLPALDAMKKMASISPVIIILGNGAHDAPGSLEIFRDLDCPYPIHVAERPHTVGLLVNGSSKREWRVYDPAGEQESGHDDVEALFHLLPYPPKSLLLSSSESISIEESNLLVGESLRAIFLGFAAIARNFKGPRLFVGHCSVSGAELSTGQILVGQDIIVSPHDLEIVGAHYYALGHIHKCQELARRMWYAGSIYHNNFGETEQKSFNLIEIVDTTVDVRRVIIPSRPLSLHEVRIDRATCELIDDDPSCDWTNAELRVRINLMTEQTMLVSDDEIRRRYPGAWSYSIERIIVPDDRIRSEGIATKRTLREKIIEWADTVDREIPPVVFAIADETEQTIGGE